MSLADFTWTNVLIWAVQCILIFVVSTLIFDALHYMLHRWRRSPHRLLRVFSSWHWVHHKFLDLNVKVHPELMWPNLLAHVMPEFLTSLVATLVFLVVFPWQPVICLVFIRVLMLAQTLYQEGADMNHMSVDRVNGKQGLLWVSPSYHAMHHVYPDNFYSSMSNVFDLIVGTTCQIRNRHFLITGASGAFGSAMKRRLETLGGIVETAKSGVDFAADDYGRMEEKLQRADVLVLAHGAKSVDCWNANYTTFAALADRFIELGKSRLVPPEIWGVGSEVEIHGDLGMAELKDYSASKRAYARRALTYYRSGDVIYRHVVPSAFTSAMGKGLMSADTAVAITLFFVRRGFAYVPVTFTGLAVWNYFRFISQRPEPIQGA